MRDNDTSDDIVMTNLVIWMIIADGEGGATV